MTHSIEKPQQKWDHGLCDCFHSTSVCCTGFWCPCILFGKTKYRLKNPGMEGFSCCNLGCAFHCIILGTPFMACLQMYQRGKVRERHNLEGGCCGDFWKACCCSCCELIQNENEVTAKNAAQAAMGYQKPVGMAYHQ